LEEKIRQRKNALKSQQIIVDFIPSEPDLSLNKSADKSHQSPKWMDSNNSIDNLNDSEPFRDKAPT
jgi:hypothetical protein